MKPVRVELDGKERQLRFDFNAMSDFEEIMGYGLFTAIQEGQIGFRTIRAFYWAGLKWKEKGLTLQRTGNMLSNELSEGKDIMDLMGPIEEALETSGIMPKDDGKEEDEADDDLDADEAEDTGKNA